MAVARLYRSNHEDGHWTRLTLQCKKFFILGLGTFATSNNDDNSSFPLSGCHAPFIALAYYPISQ